jgi:hypothetical protein
MSAFNSQNLLNIIFSNFYLNEIQTLKPSLKNSLSLSLACKHSILKPCRLFFNYNTLTVFYERMNMNLYTLKEIPLSYGVLPKVINKIYPVNSDTFLLISKDGDLYSLYVYNMCTDEISILIKNNRTAMVYLCGDYFAVLSENKTSFKITLYDKSLTQLGTYSFKSDFYNISRSSFIYWEQKLVIRDQNELNVYCLDLTKKGKSMYTLGTEGDEKLVGIEIILDNAY